MSIFGKCPKECSNGSSDCEITLTSADGSVVYAPVDGKVSCGESIDLAVNGGSIVTTLLGDVNGPSNANVVNSLSNQMVLSNSDTDRIALITTSNLLPQTQYLNINGTKTTIGSFDDPFAVNASSESISLGYNAGTEDYSGGAIVQNSNTFFIGPKCIRLSGTPSILYYNPQTGEITFGNNPGANGIQEITSTDSSVSITNPLGPITNLSVAPSVPDGTSYSDYLFWNTAGGGAWEVGTTNIHIGSNAGVTNPGAGVCLLGQNAGYLNAGAGAFCLGHLSGADNCGDNSIQIGTSSGQDDSGDKSISIGYNSNQVSGGQYSVSIGSHDGAQFNLPDYSISLGAYSANTGVVTGGLTGFYTGFRDAAMTTPIIREVSTTKSLFFNPTNGEISYSDSSSAAVAILEAQVAVLEQKVAVIESYLANNLPPGPGP